jgi:hypothetical protein
VFYQELNQTRIQRAQKKLSAAEWQKAYETGTGWKRSEIQRRMQEFFR